MLGTVLRGFSSSFVVMEAGFPASNNFHSESENRLSIGGKRKSKRRSSILKTKSPSNGVLGDLDPNSLQETGRPAKASRRSSGRRVSFATRNEVKEFSTEPSEWEHWNQELGVKTSEENTATDEEVCEYRQPASTLRGIQSLLMGSIQPQQDATLTHEENITYGIGVDFTMCHGGGILPTGRSQPQMETAQMLDMTQCYGEGVLDVSGGEGTIADETRHFDVETRTDQGTQHVKTIKRPLMDACQFMDTAAQETENPIKVDGSSFIAFLQKGERPHLEEPQPVCHGQEESSENVSKIHQVREPEQDGHTFPVLSNRGGNPHQEHLDAADTMADQTGEIQAKRSFLMGLLTPPKEDGHGMIPGKGRISPDWTVRQSCGQANDLDLTMCHGSGFAWQQGGNSEPLTGHTLDDVCDEDISDGMDMTCSHDAEIFFQSRGQSGHRSKELSLAVCSGQGIPFMGAAPYSLTPNAGKNSCENATEDVDQTSCVGPGIHLFGQKPGGSIEPAPCHSSSQDYELDITCGYGGGILMAPVSGNDAVCVTQDLEQTACVGKVLSTGDVKTQESVVQNNMDEQEDVDLTSGYGGQILTASVSGHDTVYVAQDLEQTACVGKVLSTGDVKTQESVVQNNMDEQEDVDLTSGYGGQILTASVSGHDTVYVAQDLEQTACVGNLLSVGKNSHKTATKNMDQMSCVGSENHHFGQKPERSLEPAPCHISRPEDELDLTFGCRGRILTAPVRENDVCVAQDLEQTAHMVQDADQTACVGKAFLQADHETQDAGKQFNKPETQVTDKQDGLHTALHSVLLGGKGSPLASAVVATGDALVVDTPSNSTKVEHRLMENSGDEGQIDLKAPVGPDQMDRDSFSVDPQTDGDIGGAGVDMTQDVQPENVEMCLAEEQLAVGRGQADIGATVQSVTHVTLSDLKARLKEQRNTAGSFQSQPEAGSVVVDASIGAPPSSTELKVQQSGASETAGTPISNETEEPMDTTAPVQAAASVGLAGCHEQAAAAPEAGVEQTLETTESLDTWKCDFDENLSVIMEETRDASALAKSTQDPVLEPLTVQKFISKTGIHFNTTDKVLIRRSSLPFPPRVESPKKRTEKEYIQQMSVVMPKLTFYKDASAAVEKEISVMEKKVEMLEEEFNARNPAIFQEAQTASVAELGNLRERLFLWRTHCVRTAKKKWKRNKHQLKGVLPARIKEKHQQLEVDVNVVEESLVMADECLALLEKSDMNMETRTEELKTYLSASEKEYEKLVHDSSLKAELQETLKSQNLELKELEDRRNTLASERDQLLEQKQSLRREQLETEERLRSLETEDSANQRVEELSQMHTILRGLQEWDLKEFEDEHAVFTFVRDTVELKVAFGEQSDPKSACASEKLVKSISLNTKLTDNKLSSQLTEALISKTIDMESLRNKYDNSASLPQLLDHLSCVFCKIRHLSDEVFSIGVRELTSIRDTTLSVEFASLKAFVKFTVDFSFDINTYPDILERKVIMEIGTCSVSDVEEHLDAVTPGTDYVTRLVEAAGQFLEIRKKSKQ